MVITSLCLQFISAVLFSAATETEHKKQDTPHIIMDIIAYTATAIVLVLNLTLYILDHVWSP